ncbi:RagB/SusD family nutrient uptake outer membrane protein [Mucilaginibacter paludis]|uniref:RagB/SusD domain-containing protein n=1 Tax=Mucilaginibacter paludis DSM 18603 TaxID=714943 RepID=H1YBM1_9SPHI|nr:RagB/SusD family nutrient uptake outer membrane protein [Mucilaginibacter paludis]EHQ25092.1 hypothetical protein Mucpa_0912 [Mucilaginibacter paludis DSM 18603]
MKKTFIHRSFIVLSIVLAWFMAGCKKYLDEKSSKKLVIPSNLTDLQALLDNYSTMNYSGANSHEESTNDYYLTDADYTALYSIFDQSMYTWQKEHLFDIGANGNDWSYTYRAVYFSNSVLDELNQIARTSANQTNWDNIKGQALVFRANRFLDALSIWSLAYDQTTAATDLGIPLRLDPDFNEKTVRASVQQSYQQVISDIRTAIPILPVTPASVLRPSKPAAYALLARTYLWMRDYTRAGLYADSSLQLYNKLLDYNTLIPTDGYPVKDLNAETLFERASALSDPLNNSVAKIDPLLYQSYASNDLRKMIFFKANTDGSVGFKGCYVGNATLFTGIATDEVYLTRAEYYARQNNVTAAMADLNTLLSKRWKTGKFIALTAATPADALTLILQERRKELLMRGLRWMDIKRLNKEGASISLQRTVNGQAYNLPAGDFRFALPIPDDIISLAGITQNYR